jgi:predicted dehydrogenase
MDEPITAVMLGAGMRGYESYGPYALEHPHELNFIAVAEPDARRRERFAAAHDIPKERQFRSWEDALEQDQMAQAVFNCTQDQMHYASGMAAIQSGYDMLLEKPICNTLDETVGLVQAAEGAGRLVQVCHVLRYTDYWQRVYEILGSGSLGQIITISHRENVASWHMAHSFVRGHWRSEEESAPMILAKCCHDLDLLYWMTGERVNQLSSVGSLIHFRTENAPEGAPLRCTDGCPVEDSCPYYAPALYVDLIPTKVALSQAQNPFYRGVGKLSLRSPQTVQQLAKVLPELRGLTEYKGWPRSVITEDPSNEGALMEALKRGPYGRCVYHCDNDVVDHQIVTMQFESGVSASLTMHGHSFEEGRTLRIDGSHGTLLGKFGFNQVYLEIRDHRNMAKERIDFPNQVEKRGHGGGDFGLVRSFVRAMQGERGAFSDARDSLESHLMAFAAEEARLKGTVVDMGEFRKRAELHK